MLVDSLAMLLAENARQITRMRILEINVRRLMLLSYHFVIAG